MNISNLKTIQHSNEFYVQKFSNTLKSHSLSQTLQGKISEGKLILRQKMKQILSCVFGNSYKKMVYGIRPRTDEQKIIKFQIKTWKTIRKIKKEIKTLQSPLDSQKIQEAFDLLVEIRKNIGLSQVTLRSLRDLSTHTQESDNKNISLQDNLHRINQINLAVLEEEHQATLTALDQQIQKLLKKTAQLKENSLSTILEEESQTQEEIEIPKACSKGLKVDSYADQFKAKSENEDKEVVYAFPHQFFIDLLRSQHTNFNGNFTFRQKDYPKESKEDIQIRNSMLAKAYKMLHQALSSPKKETEINLFNLFPRATKGRMTPTDPPKEEIVFPTNAMFTVMNLMQQGNLASTLSTIEKMAYERTGKPFFAGGGGNDADLPGMWMDLNVKEDEVTLTLKCPYVLRDRQDPTNDAGKVLEFQIAKREFTLSLQELLEVRPDNDKTLKKIKVNDTYSPLINDLELLKTIYKSF